MLVMLVVLMTVVQAGLIMPGRASAADFSLPGGGTDEDPYLIASGSDLDQIRMKLDAHYRMFADIDLSAYSNWTPIGTETEPFIGTFDGAGHTITGLSLSISQVSVGLFGYVGDGGKLSNFMIQDGIVDGAGEVGIAIGRLYGSVDDVQVIGGSVSGASRVGGLVGASYTGSSIINSSASAAVQSTNGIAGGLIGYAYGSIIRDSQATGNTVEGGNPGGTLGGLVGSMDGSSIEGSYSSMNVHAGSGPIIGGLVGIGNSLSTVSNSFATGNISAPSSMIVGGFAGAWSGGTVNDVFATGNVHGDVRVGGLFGSALGGVTITNSFANGAVIGSSLVGGLVGITAGGATATGSYFDEAKAGLSVTALGTALATNELAHESTFAGWDFESKWVLDDRVGYPELMAFDRTAPQVKSAIVPADTPSHLIVKFQERIQWNDATATKFSVKVNGAPIGITGGSLGADKRTIDLVLAAPAQAGQALSFSYAPTGDADEVRDLAGNKAAAISEYAVVNESEQREPTNASSPVIGTQPENRSVYVGDSASLSVTASVYGDGASLSYQWYSNGTNNNIGGTPIGGATGASFAPSTASVGTTYYYVVVTNTDSTATGVQTASVASNAAQVTVQVRPSPQTNSPSSNPTEEITVDVVNGASPQDALVSKAVIKRTAKSDGSKKDDVEFAPEQASQTVERLTASGSKLAQLVIPDAKDEVSELNVKLPVTSTGVLAQAGVDMEIYTNNVRIHIPSASMAELKDDSYFRVVPVKAAAEREQLEKRAIEEQARISLSVNGVDVIGRPMTIETNLQSRPVTLVLPIGDNDLTQEQLDNLGIYIEHSDGTKAFVRGEIVAYDNSGKQGIRFTVDHFSTFTVVHVDGWSNDGLHAAFINGYAAGTFDPDKKVTRAEIASMLVRAFGDGTASGESKVYTDVPSGYWAKSAIDEATAMGLMGGYSDGSFKPEQPVSRAEMAKIAVKLLSSNAAEAGRSFTDIAGHWAQADVEKAGAAGIVSGYADGTFRPDIPLTRAEAVKILVILLGREPVTDMPAKWTDVTERHWAYGYIQEASIDHEAALHTNTNHP